MSGWRLADPRYGRPMTDKKKAASLKTAGATQKISKDELADLLKRAEEEDPEADANEPLPAGGTAAKGAAAKGAAAKADPNSAAKKR